MTLRQIYYRAVGSVGQGGTRRYVDHIPISGAEEADYANHIGLYRTSRLVRRPENCQNPDVFLPGCRTFIILNNKRKNSKEIYLFFKIIFWLFTFLREVSI